MITAPILALTLNEITPLHYEKIGGKAKNLSKLLKANFNVPDGYVLTTDLYKHFLEYNNLQSFIKESFNQLNSTEIKDIEKISNGIKKKILNGEFSDKDIQVIKSQHDRMGYDTYAVRSSATAEDLQTASFAGQYESFLNLQTFEELISHIKKCYASLWNERVIAYCLKHDIAQKDIKIGIIVQKMVPAKSAGVLFTINPINSEKSEILIESNYGLGESVMSGACTPDQFILERCGKKTKINVKITNMRIGKKEFAIQPKRMGHESGIEHVILSDNENLSSSLKDKELLNLAQIGIEIEELYNHPQDIEWAIDNDHKINILQTRPITRQEKNVSSDKIIYSRGYGDDYWNDSVSPLFLDLLGDQLTKVVNIELNSIMGYKKMDSVLLKLYNGHVYFNLKVLRRKVENEIPGFMRNEDLLNYFPNGSGPYGKLTIKNLPFHLIKRIVAELRIMLFDPNGTITKTDKTYYEWTREKFNPYCQKFDNNLNSLKQASSIRDLFNLAQDLDMIMIDHFRLVRYGIPVHNIGMALMVQYLLTRFLGKRESMIYFPILISSLSHKLTETNSKIHLLAAEIQRANKLKTLILNSKSNELFDLLSQKDNLEIKNFFSNFKDFLKEEGDRGFTREPYYPRWNEAPELVFDILQSLVSEYNSNLDRIKEKSERKRKRIEMRVENKIRSQRFGFLKWKIFSVILSFSRRYIKFRENQRFNLDRWITRNRKIFLEIGKKLNAKGYLEKEDDIFFLRRREIKDMINENFELYEPKSLSKKIAERKEEFQRFEDTVPPKFIIGDREFNDNLEFDSDSVSFNGIPASQGIVKGSIRIITKIEDIPTVKSGEILVVPKTDPGWTPIFSKIGGLITETGGVLSHGAVVSREYGIPAITNIQNACRFLKTGQNVILNGYKGKVIMKD